MYIDQIIVMSYMLLFFGSMVVSSILYEKVRKEKEAKRRKARQDLKKAKANDQ